MYRISRIYVANAGTRLSWYPGLLLPFTDVDTGLPTQAIYNLANQGGKTTFLSLFFSIFDTKQDRFLQTLSNPGQHFVDYFDKDGLPGIIIVEWDMPGVDPRAPRKRFVTGQFVCLRASGDGLTPERHFFSFVANDKLSLDNIPGPNLPGAVKGVLHSREECVRWLHETTLENRGNFQHLTNQTDWKALLISAGLDVELLHKQVDFNRKEGAMDEAFLDFKSELDFVRRFLLLTLNQDMANDTQQLVASLCRKMTNRKQYQDDLAQMERLGGAFRPFAKAAQEYQEAMALRETAEQELGIAAATLAAHVTQKSGQVEAQSALQHTKETEHIEQSKLALEAEADAEALEDECLSRECVKAQDAVLTADNQHKEEQRRLSLAGAAKLNGEIIGLQAEVTGLEQALAEANKGTAPLRKSLGEKAALYRRMLVDLAKSARLEATQFKASAVQAKQFEKQQESLKVTAQRNKLAASSLQTEASTRLDDAATRRNSLVKTGVLGDEELISSAIERVTAERTAVATNVARFEQEATTFETEVKTLSASARSLEKENLPVRDALSLLVKTVQEGDALREALSHNRALAKAADAEICNPDSEVLPGRVFELQRHEQERWRDSELSLSRLQEGQESFELTELFGRDPDVAKVVRFLSDNGISGVRAYTEYIAHTVPNAELAREVALSNPGRFLGVAVPEPKDVEASKGLLEKAALELGRPVVISTYSTSVAATETALFVIGPNDDSLWNKSSAGKRAARWAVLLNAATAGRDAAQRVANETLLAKTKLNQYVIQFGEGKLEQLRTKGSDLREQLAVAEQCISEMRKNAEDATARASIARSEASRLQKLEMPEVSSRLQTLTSYLDDWESKISVWKQQVKDAAQTVKQAEFEYSEASAAIQKARELFDETTLQAKNREDVAAEHDRVRNGLSTADDTYDAETELKAQPRALPEMASEYQVVHTALRAVESEKTEPLVIERDLKSSLRDNKRDEYSERYPTDRFPMSEVRPLIGTDYRELERTSKSRVELALQGQITAAAAEAHAKATFGIHQKQRKHPTHTLAAAALFNGPDLAKAIETRRSESTNAAHSAQAAKDAAVGARSRARELKEQIKLYDGQRESVGGLSLDFSTVLADVSRFTDAGTVAVEVAALMRKYSSSKKMVEASEKRAQTAYEIVKEIAMDEAFSKTDYEIATMLRENPLDSSAADATRIQDAIGNRCDALSHDLSQMDDDFARATDALTGLVNDATKILRRAVEHLKLPDNVPVVGGKSVFRMRTAVLSLSQEHKKQGLSAYMEELTADRNIPETGAQLAAQALMRLADNKLGLKLLKMVEIEDEQYVPVDRLSHSGSEKLSMALFLYFITMRLRYEQRASVSRAESGVLLLDNPFAKATSRPIWNAIHSLAEAMGLQLIITTGMNEFETLSVFKRHLRLGKTQVDKTTGRIHVKVTDYQFFPTIDKVAA